MTRREFPVDSIDPPVAIEEAASLQREDRYAIVLAQDPGNRDALRRLSVLRLQRGAFEDTAALIRRFIDVDPDFPDAHNNLGVALQGLDRTSEAAQHFETAIKLAPQRPEAHYNLGQALRALGRLTQARERFERAVTLRPDYAEAHNSLGVLLAPDDPEEALACFQRALRARPNYADAHSNMGNALHVLDRDEEAMASYVQALAIKPDHPEAHNNLGMALRWLNRDAEAVACFETAQAIKPDYVDAQLNEGLSRLALGDYVTGWKKYAWRRLTASFSHGKKNPSRPLWLGNWDISGKTILLHGEQGLGDTIQFSRYVPQVARRGARVILAVQEPLAPLLREVEGVSVLRAKGEAVPPFDCYCPLPSLPLAFATTLETIPAGIPYLHADEIHLAKWRPRIDALPGKRVALAWAGNVGHANDRNRSIDLKLLEPLFSIEGISFLSIQRELRGNDAERLVRHANVSHFGGELSDMADTAAVAALADLTISVDTSVSHLAGALGKPVWVLLPFSADWRWLREREDSPWYPTMRLFRQKKPGDWADVISRVASELRKLPASLGLPPEPEIQ